MIDWGADSAGREGKENWLSRGLSRPAPSVPVNFLFPVKRMVKSTVI